MIDITENEHHITITSTDYQGEFFFRVFKDLSQIQLESGNDSAHVSTDYSELKAIRDVIDKCIKIIES